MNNTRILVMGMVWAFVVMGMGLTLVVVGMGWDGN